MVREVVMFICGIIVGVLIMGLISARSYDKGFNDGKRTKGNDK